MKNAAPIRSLGRREHAPRRFVFFLVDGLSMMSLASAIEPMRSLNRLTGRQDYEWRLASIEGGLVRASNDIPFPTEPLASLSAEADVLLVCGGLRIRAAQEPHLMDALRRAERSGVMLGSLSTGAYLLARAGLLDGYRCTIHWENRPAFEEEFPNVLCTGKIFEIDRSRLTCSGGTAAMDMMLQLIGETHSEELARRVANQFHHERIRAEDEDQRGGRLERAAALPTPLRKAVALMQDHIEDPVSIAEIADLIGLSARQLERLFLRYERSTPARYYLGLRIDRARELLLYSDRPIIDVAVATGFASISHFSQWFKRLQGVRPTELRSRRRPKGELAQV